MMPTSCSWTVFLLAFNDERDRIFENSSEKRKKDDNFIAARYKGR
jgi:hypothetical protein